MLHDYDRIFKYTLLGDSGVGKSCSLLRYVDDTYTESYITTIGVDFKIKEHSDEKTNKKIKLQIWDTAGQERFRSISVQSIRTSHAFVIYFDITDENSFKNIDKWIKQVKSNYHSEDPTIIIVGNKCDLESKRAVPTEVAQEFCDDLGFTYIETSAKEAIRVDEVFHTLTSQVLDKLNNPDLEAEPQDDVEVEVTDNIDGTDAVENQGFFSRLFNRITDFFNSIFKAIFSSTSIEVETKKVAIKKGVLPTDKDNYSIEECTDAKITYPAIGDVFVTKGGVYFTNSNTKQQEFYSKAKHKIRVDTDRSVVEIKPRDKPLLS